MKIVADWALPSGGPVPAPVMDNFAGPRTVTAMPSWTGRGLSCDYPPVKDSRHYRHD